MNLNFPLFWIFIPLVLGLGYGYFFYALSSTLPLNLRRFLFIIRTIVVFGIGLLILEPSSRWLKEIEEKPEILFLQDNSESILLSPNSSYYPTQYAFEVKSLIKELSKRYIVHTYSFGHGYREGLPFNFLDKETDFSGLSGILKDRYEGRNIGAIILATDGLFNKGNFPAESLLKLHAPVYCLGLGDTSRRKDAVLNQVEFNEVVFAGDHFPIKTYISEENLDGEKMEMDLKSGHSVVQSKTWICKGNSTHRTIEFEVGPLPAGSYTYELEIRPIPGETTFKNNSKRINILVLKSKQDILLLTGISHPDISAIKQALTSSRNNNLTIHTLQDKDPVDIQKYSCIILYQIPTSSGLNLSPDLRKKLASLPVFKIFGLQTGNLSAAYPELSKEMDDIKNQSITQSNYVNSSFQLFSYSDSLKNLVPKFPPLEGPGLFFKGIDPNMVFLFSKSSLSEKLKSLPILYFENNSGRKSATLLGEGIWKWRAFEYAETGSHRLVDGILQKIISYLTIQEDKSRFRILMPKSVWSEYEPIQIEAQLYNAGFELINKLPIRLDLLDEHGKNFHFIFSPNGNQYQLNLGNLPVGTYHYTAQSEGINPKEWKKGIFLVEPSSEEFILTQANHSLLYQISKETSGEVFLPQNMGRMLQQIFENRMIRTSIHETKGDLPWIKIPYILMAFIFLLTLEWVLRKWNGVY